ncbi:MAG: hypothetical protein IJO93_05085 [Clostridia bacterium]|nr:hypothetical protein [Clostridia bacterium]
MRKTKTILWGFALIAAGVLFALKAVDVIDFSIFFNGWWTLFIIIPGVIGLFGSGNKTGNIIGITVGVALLLACQDVISFNLLWKLLVPVMIVIIGVSLVVRGLFGGKASKVLAETQTDSHGYRKAFAAFSGRNVVVDGEVFEGAELNAIFGSAKCDLKNAVIEKDCVIKASAIFGGIDIFVPEGVSVVDESTCIFGGISNKTEKKSDTPTIYIMGTCMFGGIDIK